MTLRELIQRVVLREAAEKLVRDFGLRRRLVGLYECHPDAADRFKACAVCPRP